MTTSSRYDTGQHASEKANEAQMKPSEALATALALPDGLASFRDVEEWRPAAAGPHGYEVSSHGRVRSVDRLIADRNGRSIRLRGKPLAVYVSKVGYRRVSLGGAVHNVMVAVLVAEAFHGPRPVDAVVRHLDGDPANDWADNLAWGTQAENMADTVRHGHHHHANLTRCPRYHLLKAPNLVAASSRLGRRDCLACSRGRASIRAAEKAGRPHVSLKDEADERYARIMQGLPK